ncbi:exported hypothetical protein [uncultured Mycobacterium sp.]|uniref:Uncharacterized protein n=1 Tax=uncultured Mycobacterium sp. TaxID=171292 RepID=A0A1Y5PIS1_9MYCO|nr:exported hypothetical protein [uncultured Mycobacterium sp.]
MLTADVLTAGLTGASTGASFVAGALSTAADFFVPVVVRADTELDGRALARAGPACAVDFDDAPDGDVLLDVDDPFEAAEPVESAEATAGTEAIAAPTPSATAEAPIQVSIRR